MSLYSAVKRALKEVLSKLIDTPVSTRASESTLASVLSQLDIPLSAMIRVRVYKQEFEDGTSDLSTTNCTQAVQSAEVYAGNYALDVTIPAGNTGHIETPMVSISPNLQVTFSFAHKEDANITSVKLIVVWYRENLHEIGTEEFDLTPSTSWQLDSRTVTAPKNAAYMGLRMEATAGASDGHVYLDSMIMDLVGQVLSVDREGNLKVADTDLEDAMLNDVKGAWRLGVKDLNLASTDPELTVPSGVEVDFADMSLANKYFNYGATRCHGNCLLKAGGKLKLGAGSVFRFVR